MLTLLEIIKTSCLLLLFVYFLQAEYTETESEDLTTESQAEEPVTVKPEESQYDFDYEYVARFGVDRTFLRNDTHFLNGNIRSSPGCPEPFEGRPWIYDQDRCKLSGSEGNCRRNMIILPQTNSVYGKCACNCNSESYNGKLVPLRISHCIGTTSTGKKRILGDFLNCFPLFEQEDCSDGEWWFWDNKEDPSMGISCKKRECPIVLSDTSDNDTFSFYDYGTKTCHKIGERCQSLNVDFKDKESIYQLSEGHWTPVCCPVGNCLNDTSYKAERERQKTSTKSPKYTTLAPTIPKNYDFDLELALVSGLIPNATRKNTASNFDDSPDSSPGCPPPYDERPWILYGNPPRCYHSGRRGPCPGNMNLNYLSTSFFGVCSCCINTDAGVSIVGTCIGLNSERERWIVHTNMKGECKPLFEQGTCGEGEWLAFGKQPSLSVGPVCEKRRCAVAIDYELSGPFSFYNHQTKSCHHIYDECPLYLNIHGTRGDGTLLLSDKHWIPNCESVLPAAGYIQHTTCSASQNRDKDTGTCVTNNLPTIITDDDDNEE